MNLNTKLNLYEYGLPINGVITDVTSADYYDKNYKSLSPKEFDTFVFDEFSLILNSATCISIFSISLLLIPSSSDVLSFQDSK